MSRLPARSGLRAHLAAKSYRTLTKKSGTAEAIPDFFASVQVCGYHNTKGKNVLSWLQLCGVVTKRHFTFGKRFAGSPALVYVPTDFDTKEKALSGEKAAEKGLK